MQFLIAIPVKALGHEMRSPALLQQTAGAHLDACGFRHQVMGVLDPTEPCRRPQLTVRADIELEQP